jgi:hypothetical protein
MIPLDLRLCIPLSAPSAHSRCPPPRNGSLFVRAPAAGCFCYNSVRLVVLVGGIHDLEYGVTGRGFEVSWRNWREYGGIRSFWRERMCLGGWRAAATERGGLRATGAAARDCAGWCNSAALR